MSYRPRVPLTMDHPAQWLAVLRIAVGLYFVKSLVTKMTIVLLGGFLPVPAVSARWIEVMPKIVGRQAAENPILFYPRRVVESLTSGVRWAQLFLKFRPALKRVKADESARTYTDLALSASSDEELNEMDLIQVFKGAIPRTHGAPAVAREPALP